MFNEPKKSLMEGWTIHRDNDGRDLYRNEITGESVTTRPILPAEYVWISQPDELECYHILVKHATCRQPSSWRQPVVTRTRAEAIQLIKRRVYYENCYTLEKFYSVPMLPGENVWISHPRDLECYHILVKHADVRRPTSWRERVITRTRLQALQDIYKYRALIVARKRTFQDIARKYSDCPSAVVNGHLRRNRQRFAAELFELSIGQVSPPIETSSGLHLLLRTH